VVAVPEMVDVNVNFSGKEDETKGKITKRSQS